MAETQVGGDVSADDGLVGLGHYVIYQKLDGLHAFISPLHRIALAEIQVHRDVLGVPVQVILGEYPEHRIIHIIGSADGGDVKGLAHREYRIRHYAAGGGRVGEQPAHECSRVRDVPAGLLVQEFTYGFLGVSAVFGAADLHKLFAGIPAHIEPGLAGEEFSGKRGHTYQAAGHYAGDGPDRASAAVEDALVFRVHPAGNLAVLLDSARSKTAVHPGVQIHYLLYLVESLLPFGSKKPGLLERPELFHQPGIAVPGPRITGAVTAVVTDVEGLVAARNRRLLRGEVLVRIGIDSGPLKVLVDMSDNQGVLGFWFLS